MADTVLAQHPPAMKIGGRRLSMASRPKPHIPMETSANGSSGTGEEPVDYPRPAPPGAEQPHAPLHHEEEPPKKEKKHSNYDSKTKEGTYRMMEGTRPTRDMQAGRKDFGAGGRIAQPAGKALGA